MAPLFPAHVDVTQQTAGAPYTCRDIIVLAKQCMEELFALYIEINVTITHSSSGDACGLTLCFPSSKWKTVEHDRIVPTLFHTYDDPLSFKFSHRYLWYISHLRHEVRSSYVQKFNFYLTGDTARREYLFNDVFSS